MYITRYIHKYMHACIRQYLHNMWKCVAYSLSGGELFDQIADEDNKMTEGDVVRYVRQVCDGISHMHDQNIVHLDIKVSLVPSLNDFC